MVDALLEAGLVSDVADLYTFDTARAAAILKELEAGKTAELPPCAAEPQEQVSMLDMTASALQQKLEAIQVETLTPIEAMNVLYELKQMVK